MDGPQLYADRGVFLAGHKTHTPLSLNLITNSVCFCSFLFSDFNEDKPFFRVVGIDKRVWWVTPGLSWGVESERRRHWFHPRLRLLSPISVPQSASQSADGHCPQCLFLSLVVADDSQAWCQGSCLIPDPDGSECRRQSNSKYLRGQSLSGPAPCRRGSETIYNQFDDVWINTALRSNPQTNQVLKHWTEVRGLHSQWIRLA